MHARPHSCTNVYVCTYPYPHTHTNAHAFVCVWLCTYVYVYQILDGLNAFLKFTMKYLVILDNFLVNFYVIIEH